MLQGAGINGFPVEAGRQGDRRIERFATQTQLIARFCELTRIPALCIEGGSSAFFREFREYMAPGNRIEPSDLIAIPVDPTDFIAFPCAADELRLALLMGGEGAAVAPDLDALAGRYGLDQRLLHQPIRTLSGGERALVALAKAEALLPSYEGLVMASPTTWLNESRRHLVTELCDRFEARGKTAQILLLEGDWPELDGTGRSYAKGVDQGRVAWRLALNGLAVTFPATNFPNQTGERTLVYRHDQPALELVSPTLIQGDNGIGKSSLALILAGVLAPSEGKPTLTASGNSGTARLLLQDTLRQMFAMSSVEHVNAVYRYDQERKKSVDAVLDRVDGELRLSLADFAGAIATLDESGRPSSLLHDKLALAFERLIARPNLLVLDEPLWGLSDILGRKFIELVVREAHARQVPVAIISHESSWLEHLYHSRLSLTQTADGKVEVTAHVL